MEDTLQPSVILRMP